MLNDTYENAKLSEYLGCLANYQHSLSASDFSVLFMIFAGTVGEGRTEIRLTYEQICGGLITEDWQHGGTQLTLPTVRKAIRTLTGYGIVKIVKSRKRLTGAVYTLGMINNLAYNDWDDSVFSLPEVKANPSLS